MPFLIIISRKDNEDVAVLLPHALFWFSTLLPGGLKILILNGPGLQIQTNGTQPNIRWVRWVGTNIRGGGDRAEAMSTTVNTAVIPIYKK
jgi:hypothetical protein